MLQNHEFMKKAPGKLLSLRLQHHVRFDDQNRIVYVNIEHQIVQAWCNDVIHPSELAKLALSRMEQVNSTFISTNYQQLMNDRQFTKKKLRQF